jgi:LPS sulfotransferase NodH
MAESRKGYLMLTEARSGSNWLGSLANGTEQMGILKEWLDPAKFGMPLKSLDVESFLQRLVSLSSTSNNRFALKLFPGYLLAAHRALGIDVIEALSKRYDVSLVKLTRHDRIAQAVSLVKAAKTRQWTSNILSPPREEEKPYTILVEYVPHMLILIGAIIIGMLILD